MYTRALGYWAIFTSGMTMGNVTEHYEKFLARRYTWMLGGFDAKLAEGRAFVEKHAVSPHGCQRAVDLGCGPGFHALPLARQGYTVTAIDTSYALLGELEAHRHQLPVRIVHDDIRNFTSHCPNPVELIVCLGDTLPHLATREEVQHLFEQIYHALENDGQLILTFRDLTAQRTGTDRFIPVRNDADRIFTCFLEYQPDHVQVHDLVYERKGDGWIFSKSAYRKVRLGLEWCREQLKMIGFIIKIAETDANGLATIVAHKRDLS